MIENILEIFLITYNRSSFLDSTLRAMLDGPFARCRITVLDNCSKDDTLSITAKYRFFFPDYHVIRHARNIGGDVNYLRAVEMSTAEYIWILCDDDAYDFSAADEVIAALISGRHDMVIVGPIAQSKSVRNRSARSKELVESGFMYYQTLSFFAACIFRADIFDSDCLIKGYDLCAERYPQFAFINATVQKNIQVYIPSSPIVIRNDVNASTVSPLAMYSSWLTCCKAIPDNKLRIDAIDAATKKRGFIKSLGIWVPLERHVGKVHYWKKIINVYLGLNAVRRFLFLLLIPVIVFPIPLRILAIARSFVYAVMKVDKRDIPPLEVVDRDA